MQPSSYNQGINNSGGQGMDYGGTADNRQMGFGQGAPPYFQGGSQHGYPGISHSGTMQAVAQQNYNQQQMNMMQQQFGSQSSMTGARSSFGASQPQSNIGIAQNLAAHSQSSSSGMASQQNPMISKQEPKRQLFPLPFPQDVLDDLPNMSVGMLCTVGKELVHELNIRTVTLCGTLKAQTERKQVQHGQDPQLLIDYCTKLFEKLAEIRILIDKQQTGNEKSLESIFEDMTDMSDPVDDSRPEEVKQLADVFRENKEKLATLNNDLKMLDWMATVSDPGTLKKVDKMSTSFKNEGHH